MLKKILFVDDEPSILTGLNRMLRSMRKEWDMHFVESAKAALKTLQEEGNIDVIVSDIRMPEMDGVELLSQVKLKYPSVIRIILSGHSDYDSALSSTRVAHQYLAKPCDAQLLKKAVDRSFQLKAILHNDAIEKLAAERNSLPSPPRLYIDVMHEIQSPEGSMAKISELVAQDVAMTAKVLQLINSAFFGLPRDIVKMNEAISYLGLNTLQGLMAMHEIFSSYDEATLSFDIDKLWHHSLHVATLAKNIAGEEGFDKKFQDQAFLVGMLHDIGVLLLVMAKPEKVKEIEQQHELLSLSWQQETEYFGCTHAAVGGYLLGLWGIPSALVEPVVYHHQPSLQSHAELDLVAILHISEAICSNDPDQWQQALDMDYITKLGVEKRLDIWQGLLQSSTLND